MLYGAISCGITCSTSHPSTPCRIDPHPPQRHLRTLLVHVIWPRTACRARLPQCYAAWMLIPPESWGLTLLVHAVWSRAACRARLLRHRACLLHQRLHVL